MDAMMGVFLIAIAAGLGAPGQALAPEGHHHPPGTAVPAGPKELSPSDARKAALERIGHGYASDVQPIFTAKCMDCHSGRGTFPWYHAIPGVKQWLDSDVAESREHLDMSDGFPFKGHGTTEEDLQAIRKDLNEGTMPPLRYRIMHPDSKLTDAELAAVVRWTEEGERLLKER